MSETQVSQSLAIFESGEPKDHIDFEPAFNELSLIEGRGEDNFYSYVMRPYDIPCNGTLLVKNKKTGEMKAIPVQKYFSVSRECKIHEFTKLDQTDTAALVNQFGTRQAKRIYSMRQGSSKT